MFFIRSKNKRLFNLYRNHKSTLITYVLLRTLVMLVAIRSIYNHEYYNAFLCFISLILMIIPGIFEKTFQIDFPNTLEIIMLVFIFASEILGEIESFYTIHFGWDTVLHTISGFLSCAIGFSLFEIINRYSPNKINISPFYLTLMAFCFANTIGVLWEFGEFAVDKWLLMDSQNDFLITEFSSVYFNSNGLYTPVILQDIVNTTITLADGTQYVVNGGYLDIGIIDTMKDLFVNSIGALVFSFFGYYYVKNKGKGKFASRFIPTSKRNSFK